MERYTQLRFTRDVYKGWKEPEVVVKPGNSELIDYLKDWGEDNPQLNLTILPLKTETIRIKRQMKRISKTGK